MAYRYKSPHYSFVNFNNQFLENDWPDSASPYSTIKFCLPFIDNEDVAFQIIIEADTNPQGNSVWNENMANLKLGIHTGEPISTITDVDFNTLPLIASFADLGAHSYRLNTKQVLFFIPKLPDVTENFLQPGQCFQLALRASFNGSSAILAVSNCFKEDDGNHYTSILKYRGDEDEAGFRYCMAPLIENRVRLPLYTSKILYAEDQNVYRQSTGALTIIKAEVGKAYEVLTDYMPEWAHDCLQAALLHDTKTIITAKYAGNFHKSGNYELEHPKFMDYPLIPAKFKIDATPMLLKNNISGDCTPPDLLSGVGAYQFTFEACTTVELSLATLGITALCAPVTANISFINTALLNTYSINGSTLIFNFLSNQPIPANINYPLCEVTYNCPGGDSIFYEIFAKWNGSVNPQC